MATRATFPRLALYSCEFSKASHIFFHFLAFGECQLVWQVLHISEKGHLGKCESSPKNWYFLASTCTRSSHCLSHLPYCFHKNKFLLFVFYSRWLSLRVTTTPISRCGRTRKIFRSGRTRKISGIIRNRKPVRRPPARPPPLSTTPRPPRWKTGNFD